MDLRELDDAELLELCTQSAKALRDAMTENDRSIIDEYTTRHGVIVAACQARGLSITESIRNAAAPAATTPAVACHTSRSCVRREGQ